MVFLYMYYAQTCGMRSMDRVKELEVEVARQLDDIRALGIANDSMREIIEKLTEQNNALRQHNARLEGALDASQHIIDRIRELTAK